MNKSKIFSDFSTPLYNLTLPSGTKIKYRPFLVKHEKSLYYAFEEYKNNNDLKIVVDTIKSILSECVISDDPNFSLESLPIFDIEFLFLLIRSNSTGDDIVVKIVAPDDNKTEIEHCIPIDKITFKTYENHTNVINIDNFIFNFKYPNIDFLYNSFSNDNFDNIISVIFSLIESVQVISNGKTFSQSELDYNDFYEFISNLPKDEFSKFVNFLNTIPKIYYEAKIQNPKTKKYFNIKFEGLNDFLQ